MVHRTRSVAIWELSPGDVIETHLINEPTKTIKTIEKVNRKRLPWVITWSNGTTTEHGVSAQFRVRYS